MNKLISIGILLFPTMILAGALSDGTDMVGETGTLFGTIIVVVAVSLWLLPIAFAGLVYTGQKKKSEQMHEEVGLKAAILALLAGVLGAAMAFYVVGTIGKYAQNNPDGSLKAGNRFLLSTVIGKGVTNIK